MDNFEKIETVIDHIQNVQRNCLKLGIKLIKAGRFEFGRDLIANGQLHDNSKLRGIEFDRLFAGEQLLPEAIKHHRSVNLHHPEYWGTIHDMPEIYLAEMVCDCTARSAEFGTDIRLWFSHEGTARYNFSMTDSVGVRITNFLDILLGKTFVNTPLDVQQKENR